MGVLFINSGRFGAAASWTPADLSPMAWWDASDSSTITLNGSNVSAWASKVNSWSLSQGTASNQPAYTTAGINGRNCVTFDGTNDGLSVASFAPGSNKVTVWAVFTAASGTFQVLAETSSNYNANDDSFVVYRETTNKVEASMRDTTTGSYPLGYARFQSSGTLTTTVGLAVAVFDRSLGSSKTTVHLNGSSAGTRPEDSQGSTNFASYTLYVGSRGGSSSFLNGKIGELGVVAGALGSTDLASLLSYSQSKWGTP